MVQLEELKQAMSTPSDGIDNIMKRVVSQASHEQSVNNTMARTASLTSSQMARSNNSFHSPTMTTAAPSGSSVTDFEIVGRDMKRAKDESISYEPSPKRLAADDSPSVNEI